MVFSDTTNKDGIIQMIEQTTGYGDANISGDSTVLAYFTGLINDWLYRTNQIIQDASHEWHYDDFNHANFNIEAYDTVDGQQDYGLDTDGEKNVKIPYKVEIRDASTGDYHYIPYRPQEFLFTDRFGQESGKPATYWLNGGSIIFDRPVDSSQVDKFRLTYDRNAHPFATDDTTAEPGFDKKYHWILIYGPSMDWAGLNERGDIYQMCDVKLYGDRRRRGLIKECEDFYAQRSNRLNQRRIKRASHRYR